MHCAEELKENVEKTSYIPTRTIIKFFKKEMKKVKIKRTSKLCF